MRESQPKSARCVFFKTRWLCYKNQVEVHFLPNVDGWAGGCRIEKMHVVESCSLLSYTSVKTKIEPCPGLNLCEKTLLSCCA